MNLEVFRHGPIELRLGRWQDVLDDVVGADAVVTDPPYSARTHKGHFSGCAPPEGEKGWAARTGVRDLRGGRRSINYGSWDHSDVKDFVSAFGGCTGWLVVLSDHVLARSWEECTTDAGRYAFAPLPFFEPGKCPRLSGDGPASWTCWINVSRQKTKDANKYGSLPGGYVLPRGQVKKGERKTVIGGKPLWLMRVLVRDYTKPNDMICDPCAGGATTLIAAAIEGRRAIGAERDPETFAKAVKRIKAGYTPSML